MASFSLDIPSALVHCLRPQFPGVGFFLGSSSSCGFQFHTTSFSPFSLRLASHTTYSRGLPHRHPHTWPPSPLYHNPVSSSRSNRNTSQLLCKTNSLHHLEPSGNVKPTSFRAISPQLHCGVCLFWELLSLLHRRAIPCLVRDWSYIPSPASFQGPGAAANCLINHLVFLALSSVHLGCYSFLPFLAWGFLSFQIFLVTWVESPCYKLVILINI